MVDKCLLQPHPDPLNQKPGIGPCEERVLVLHTQDAASMLRQYHHWRRVLQLLRRPSAPVARIESVQLDLVDDVEQEEEHNL